MNTSPWRDGSTANGGAGAWRVQAACRNLDTNLFFPSGDTGEALDQADQARAVCAQCPVQVDCVEFALATNQHDGIFGGLTAEERRSLRRRRARERRQAS